MTTARRTHASRPALRRIEGLARAAEIASIVALVVLSASIAYLMVLLAANPDRLDALLRRELLPAGADMTPTTATRAIAFGLGLVEILVGLFALDRARRLFRGYRAGEILTAAAAERLGTIGWAVFALAPVSILSRAGAVLALTVMNEPGARHLSVSLREGDVLAIVFGLLLVVVARILAEAALVAEENKAFV